MPSGQRWPATAKMRAMFNQGLTFQEIAERVEEMEGWLPSRSGVKRYYDRMGMPSRRPATAKTLIPWRVATEHNSHRYRHMLSAESKRRRHEGLSPTDRKLLESMNALLYGRGTLLVIDYNYDAGWGLRDREPDDTDIIRAPRRAEVLRLDIQAQLQHAQSDQQLVAIAINNALRPEVLESMGRQKAAVRLRDILAQENGQAAGDEDDEPSIASVHQVASEFADAVRLYAGKDRQRA